MKRTVAGSSMAPYGVALLLALGCLPGCADGPGRTTAASRITIQPDSVLLRAGAYLRVNPVFVGGAPEPLAFASGDSNIVTVDSAGLVRTRWPGTATILVHSTTRQGLSATARIVVIGPALRVRPNPTSVPAGWGGTSVTVEATGVAATPILFRSGDTTIAAVDSTGFVCGFRLGTTFLRALAAADTTVQDSAVVRVVQMPVPPVPPPWYLLFSDTLGNVLNTVSGTVVATVSWQNWRCDPEVPIAVRLQIAGDSALASPNHSWRSGTAAFRVTVPAVLPPTPPGWPTIPDGYLGAQVQFVRSSDGAILGGFTVYTPVQR